MKCKIMILVFTIMTLFAVNAHALELPPSIGKPIQNFTLDGKWYWWYNYSSMPAYCVIYYPNGMTDNFWLAPWFNSTYFPVTVTTDCNFY